MVSLLSFGYLSYSSYTYSPLSNQWKGYAAAAALVISIVPYTLTLMGPGVNKKLLDAAQGVQIAEAAGIKPETVMKDATAKKLFDDWAKMSQSYWSTGRQHMERQHSVGQNTGIVEVPGGRIGWDGGRQRG